MGNPFVYIWRSFRNLIYPPKCVLCQKVLVRSETDLCSTCRVEMPDFVLSRKHIAHVSGWTALWYYKGYARDSVLRYKFGRRRYYRLIFGRLLAMRVLTDLGQDFDLVTWVTPHWRRKVRKPFDHGRALAKAVAKELELPMVRTLTKSTYTAQQAGLGTSTQRRGNLSGAFKGCKPQRFQNKRILLVDDIVTTGSTAEECAKTLLAEGAQAVSLAAVAATEKKQNPA